MNFELVGEAGFQLAKIHLGNGETAKIENGAMVYMQDVTLEGKLNSNKKGLGGFLSAMAKSIVSDESIFITQVTGTTPDGVVAIAPSVPGKIAKLEVGARQYRLNDGAFFACDDSVNYKMQKQDLSQAFFGGSGGLFVMETEGQGDMLIAAYGGLVEVECTPAKPVTIDNEHVVAWDASLSYSIEVASGSFGFTTGEGLVNRFTGSGKILIQTRNINALADAVKPFLPDKSSK
ncbi:MAG: TIGR00266 family protein [Galactobacillus timonensis]|nr:TIGR00266 family protein [Galactobacillus timonensis]